MNLVPESGKLSGIFFAVRIIKKYSERLLFGAI
jgi:hypothetical protein